MYRIQVVCTGNLCRSPISQLVLARAFGEAGLAARVQVDSAGLEAWDDGEPMDGRSAAVLARNGFSSEQTEDFAARPFRREEIPDLDLILALDEGHEARLLSWTPPEHRSKIHLLRSFDPQAASLPAEGLSVPDPWFGEDTDFDAAYADIAAAAPGVVAAVRAWLDESDPEEAPGT